MAASRRKASGSISPRIAVVAAAFLVVALIAGVLGAQGARWLTLVRELTIAFCFFAVILGGAALSRHPERLRWVLGGVAFVVIVSSAASVLALLTQKLYPFETPIASLVPDVIASTRLGELSFTERSLGSWSYFLGFIFVRPQGIFLFSTSQAVAFAGVIPVLVAAGLWYPSSRWWFWPAAGIGVVGLLATTTRMPIAALAICVIGTLVIYGFASGELQAAFRRHRWVPAAGVILLLALTGAVVTTGILSSAVRGLTARSLGPRAELYVATIAKWSERPLLGWGTELDRAVEDSSGQPAVAEDAREEAANAPPLGSHSHYLGVLFKQGIVGSVLFAAFIAALFSGIRRQLASRELAAALVVAGAVAILICGLTESLWLDPAAALFAALPWGLAIASPRPAHVVAQPSPAPTHTRGAPA